MDEIYSLQGITFVWNAKKAQTNRADHRVSFEQACQVLFDPFLFLVDASRKLFRQLLPGSLAERLIPEWQPVFYLEEALMSGQEYGWPAYMWVAPRAMRNSSEMSPGLVDWDVYFFAGNKLTRTLRIRVESKPKQSDNSAEIMAVTSALLMSSASVNPIMSSVATYGAGAMSVANPPEAGRSLEIMTELATRQIAFLAQFPINELNPPDAPIEAPQTTVEKKFKEWRKKIFSPK